MAGSERATAFLLWREGVSVGWRCTVAELADAVGVSASYARNIVRSRGWPLQPDGAPYESRARQARERTRCDAPRRDLIKIIKDQTSHPNRRTEFRQMENET